MRRLLSTLRAIPPRSALALASFAAVVIGLAIERLSLALIVPGAFVFLALCWTKVRGAPTNPEKTEDVKS